LGRPTHLLQHVDSVRACRTAAASCTPVSYDAQSRCYAQSSTAFTACRPTQHLTRATRTPLFPSAVRSAAVATCAESCSVCLQCCPAEALWAANPKRDTKTMGAEVC
jgi:hypothetical protein